MSVSRQLIQHWSQPDTKILSVASCSSLHVTVATPWATALTGQLNQVRVANRFQTLREPRTCLSQHVKTSIRLGGRDHLDPSAMKASMQSTIVYSELGQALKRPSHLLHPDLSQAIFILFCYWTHAGLGERLRLAKFNPPSL